jgi:hypothetical protein
MEMRFEDWFNQQVRGLPPRPMSEEERREEAHRTAIAKLRAQLRGLPPDEREEEILRLVGWEVYARYGEKREATRRSQDT